MSKVGCGKIYKLYIEGRNECYIGSTFLEYVSQRLKGHRYRYKAYKKGTYHFITSFALFDINQDVQVVELQRHDNISKAGLKKYELEEIQAHPTCVNKLKPQNIESEGDQKQWRKEYNEINKETRANKQKNYYKAKKEAIAKRKKEKYICSVCGSKLTLCNKSQHERTAKHQQALLAQAANVTDI